MSSVCDPNLCSITTGTCTLGAEQYGHQHRDVEVADVTAVLASAKTGASFDARYVHVSSSRKTESLYVHALRSDKASKLFLHLGLKWLL